ncbi:DUF543-domain-containing protein [Exidia glandulosa HHB12029]|uniref:MICOS complex subunit MIC10 n=1 Tax=Exidia glandulosa HHB12029 TaxID=1314781 RepID=A0A165HN94_EXIGL|nr:DUF543-domain-containing protein [Exidia glandulosa HHB12029]KZV95834.1 DUF543-domain-containing protein [Exidia glandulosa HHB12029]
MSNTSTAPAPPTASASTPQDIVGQKFDRCLADHIVKAGLGFSAGVVLSVLLFKRRAWPISLSTGIGLGMAYADCDRSFNPTRVPGLRVVPTSTSTPPTPPS